MSLRVSVRRKRKNCIVGRTVMGYFTRRNHQDCLLKMSAGIFANCVTCSVQHCVLAVLLCVNSYFEAVGDKQLNYNEIHLEPMDIKSDMNTTKSLVIEDMSFICGTSASRMLRFEN